MPSLIVSYCISYVQLISLGDLLFSERQRKRSGSRGEDGWLGGEDGGDIGLGIFKTKQKYI